jgi:3',5'-cyclic-nucleotide phosphodiesterase
MLYLINLENNQETAIQRDTVIGREYPANGTPYHFVRIAHPQISRTHAKLLNINGNYFIQDLNSTNGTFLNNQRIAAGVMQPLNDQVTLHFGTAGFQVRIEVPTEQTGSFSLASEHVGGVAPSASFSIIDTAQQQPDVSMVMDASQIINQLRGKTSQQIDNYDEIVKRLQAMIDVSIALGELDNRYELLKKITDTIFEIFPHAQRALIITHNETTGESVPLTAVDKQGNEQKNLAISTTILNEVLNNKNSLLLMDAQSDSRFGAQESVVDLSLKSVMCAPLLFNEQVLGFMQVDTREGGYLFTRDDLQVLTGIASQVAIALKNSQLFEEIENLFEGFVRASVQAIEARDPTTAGHSFRVADYTEKLAMVVDSTDKHGLKDTWFDRQQIQELRYASLLHDFGKVGVREHVLTKAKKLYPHELELIKQRFKYAKASLENNYHKSLVDKHIAEQLSHTEFYAEKRKVDARLKEELGMLESFLNKITRINEPERLTEALENDLSDIYQYQFLENGAPQNILTEFEFSLLGLTYGSLNPEERVEIESHVSHTFAFLKLIPWTGNLASVPDIAHAHHERLDGSGYPQGLAADDIPVQSKIMAIADVYDALTAGDRPYRKGIQAEHALDIIAEEVKRGRLDRALFNVFVESESYKLD